MGDTRKSASVVVNVTLISNAWEAYKIVRIVRMKTLI